MFCFQFDENPSPEGRSSLRKKYSEKVKLIVETGSGVKVADFQAQDTDSVCYKVPAAGPNENTAPEARNIWGKNLFSYQIKLSNLMVIEQIAKDFIYFPQLHGILSTHPNLNPIQVVMGYSPHGREVTCFRELLEKCSQPTTTNNSQPISTNNLVIEISDSESTAPVDVTPKQELKHKAKLEEAKSKSIIKPIAQKHSWETAFVAIQQYVSFPLLLQAFLSSLATREGLTLAKMKLEEEHKLKMR